ncbi:hypothetical protein [Chitiniphilus eburneus]|uniref:hypothetical protein n=1 Tax=Chitiniphilus eburneus TaxID=2571148 RepID=UPI0035D0F8CB
MSYEKLFTTLASVIVGWLLAQITGSIKEVWKIRKIKKCLIEELQELEEELERTKMIYAKSIQIHALSGIGTEIPTPLSNHIFKNYYKDAVLSLSKQQRISYQLIHTLIESTNQGIREFSKLTGSLQEKHMLEGIKAMKPQEFQQWGKSAQAEFKNISSCLWHVRHHKLNPKHPELNIKTEASQDFLDHEKKTKDEIETIIYLAKKNLTRDYFQ